MWLFRFLKTESTVHADRSTVPARAAIGYSAHERYLRLYAHGTVSYPDPILEPLEPAWDFLNNAHLQHGHGSESISISFA